MEDTPLIFISYASPDRERVIEFHDYLANMGLNVWMDKRRLKGGQNWNFEINRALEKAVVVVIFLSTNSVDRRGYAQREIKIALDHAQEKLVDDIYIVPVMLDPVSIPAQLKSIHVIQAIDSEARAAVADAISHQLNRLSYSFGVSVAGLSPDASPILGPA